MLYSYFGAVMLSFAVIPSTVHLNIICDLLTRLIVNRSLYFE